MFARSLLLLLVLFPAAAEARSRPADLAVQRVAATAGGKVRFEVVNRGGTRSRAATLRAELGGTTKNVRQPALRSGRRTRHVVRLTVPRPGAWKARVCVRPRGERARRNDCATAARALTIPAPTSAGEVIVGAARAPEVTSTPDAIGPAPSATRSPTPSATSTPTPTPTASPVASPSPSAPGDVATTYQQNAKHDGNVSGAAPEAPLAVAWTKTLDSSASAPVIADGRVFVVTAYGVVHALDLRNGATLWKKGIGTRGGTITYDRGRVFATDEYGLLYASDAASGLTLWLTGTATDVQPVAHDGLVFGPSGTVVDGATGKPVNRAPANAPAAATPTLDGDRIYYACEGAAALSRGTSAYLWRSFENLGCARDGRPAVLHGGRLYATGGTASSPATIYDAGTGAEVGTFAAQSSPAFADDIGLFVENGILQARDATTYAPRWSFTGGAENVFHPPPLIAGEDVFYADGNQVTVLDLRSGAVRDTLATSGQVSEGMAIAQGALVLSAGSVLTAIRGETAPAQPGPADATPAPVDLGPPAPLPGASTHAHVNAAHTAAINLSDPAPPLKRRWQIFNEARQAIVADGRIFAIGPVAQRLDPATGAVLWSYPAGATNAAYDRGRLFIGTKTEGLVALDPETGARLWSVTNGSTAPVAADGELYGGGGSSVVRYDPATGAQLWRFDGEGYPRRNQRTVSLEGPYVYPGGNCLVLSRATGQPVKTLEGCPDSEHPFAPVHAGHMFESGLGQSGLHDIDLTRGTLVHRMGSVAPPAMIGNLLITSGGEVKAYDFPSWTPRWKYKERYSETMAVPPLIVGRHVYFAFAEGFLRAVDVDTGQVVWSDSLGENLDHYSTQVGTSMAVGDGLLIVPNGLRMAAYESAG